MFWIPTETGQCTCHSDNCKTYTCWSIFLCLLWKPLITRSSISVTCAVNYLRAWIWSCFFAFLTSIWYAVRTRQIFVALFFSCKAKVSWEGLIPAQKGWSSCYVRDLIGYILSTGTLRTITLHLDLSLCSRCSALTGWELFGLSLLYPDF